MYNRCSADPEGNPWPKEARLAAEHGGNRRGYVYWDGASSRWVGFDVPDFALTKAPNTPAQPTASVWIIMTVPRRNILEG